MKTVEEKLSKLRNDAKINNVPILRPQTAELLKNKVEEIQPKRILEIGTAIGYSGILMLSVSSARLVTIEKDENTVKEAQSNFNDVNMQDRVEIMCGDAMEVIQSLKGKFEFIFLDGPKGQYIKYLPYLLNLLEVNGILFSDNVLYRGMVNGKTEVKKSKKTLVKNLRLFLEELNNNTSVENVVLEIEDGISITKKIKE